MSIRWQGRGKDVKQVDLITVALTWATGDTITITINSIDLVVTVGANTTTAQVAITIKEAFMGTTFTDTTATSSPTNAATVGQGGGRFIAEFAEITATVSGSVVTLTANTAGKPFTLTCTETTAGDGTATRSGSVTCTGRHYFDNADNWEGGTVPTNEDVVFDTGDVGLWYNLDQNALTLASLTITDGYTGTIGLPDVNTDNASKPYNEYREKKLKISATLLNITLADGGAGSSRIRLNLGTVQTLANIASLGARIDDAYPAIQIVGTHAANVINIQKGDVGIANLAGETAVVATLRQGYMDDLEGDTKVLCGAGVTLGTVIKSGGILRTWSAIATAITQTGGTTEINGTATATGVNVRGGVLKYNTNGTLGGNPSVSGQGVIDFNYDLRTVAVTNPIEVYGLQARVLDRNKRVTTLVLDMNEGADVGQHELGDGIRLTRGTPV